LADWTPFYALMGGVAATLLGLLFVSLSLRLDLFHRRAVADVRDFALFAFGAFLVAIVIAGLALAPRPRQELVAWAVLAMGLLGLLAMIGLARVWVRLNPTADVARPGLSPSHWQSWFAIAALCGSPIGLVVAGAMLRSGHPDALGWLAIVEGWLLGQGAVAAWLVLSHAGGSPLDGGEPS
jgi:disulfide bond formation protein DsbB